MKHFIGIMALLFVLAPSALSQVAGSAAPVKQEIIKLEKEKDAAFERGDTNALRRLYADDYIAIAANGNSTTKNEVLGIFTRSQIYELYRSEEISVRVFGDTAIVTGLLRRRYYRDIKPQDNDSLRYTNIYVVRQGEWRIVAAQFTRVKK